MTEDRRAHPTDDLATVIATTEVNGCPMESNARFWYYTIVATAGHDTTSFALSGGLEALLRHPDQVALLQERPDLVNNAVDEMIRWTSPVRHFLRYLTAPATLSGVDIPEGDRLLLSYPSANRDERMFDEPMEFDAARPNANRMIAFGGGEHFCLGSTFARRELRTMLPEAVGRGGHHRGGRRARVGPGQLRRRGQAPAGGRHVPVGRMIRMDDARPVGAPGGR